MAKQRKKHNKFWRPKGRELNPKALEDIEALLADKLHRRDLLIECLHVIQDQYSCLSKAHLHALASWLGIAPVEVYEVATFYHHFDVVEDDEDAPPKLTIRVCDSISCALADAESLIVQLEKSLQSDAVRIQRVPCVGRCEQAPVAVVGQYPIAHASVEKTKQALKSNHTKCPELESKFSQYIEQGGYTVHQACLAGQRTAEEVINILRDANLRGLGGAGFPAGQKWQILRDLPGPRWIAVNIDEGEPGTFKDRAILEAQPHALLEGILIAAWAIHSEQCVLYVRDEYPAIRQALIQAIEELENWADFSLPNVQVRRGAGAYICGEESAMLESIEGKRGLPRQRPPYIAENGLFGLPTLEHNAETLYWVPELLQKGVDWYLGHGRNGRSGLRRYSLSGRINKPGVYLAPAGISVRALIDEYGGGMQAGHAFYGYLPGGASGGILPASVGDEPLDFDTLQKHGCFIGSAAVIVFSNQDRARDIAQNAMKFMAHESCGQCTPCRVGTVRAAAMMCAPKWQLESLEELACVMEDASICGLGQAAPNPMRCVIKYFPEEIS